MVDSFGTALHGFVGSAAKAITIAAGQTGVNNAGVDMGRQYAVFMVTLTPTSGPTSPIPASATLRAQVAFSHDDALSALAEQNDPGTQWSKTIATVPLTFPLTFAFGVRRLNFVLSAAALAGGLTITVRGYDPVRTVTD